MPTTRRNISQVSAGFFTTAFKGFSDVMRAARRLLIAVLALACGAPRAQVAIQSDIGVTLTATPTTNLTPGQLVSFTLTVTNYGPLPASILVLDSSMFTDEIAGFITNPDECYLVGTIVDGVVPSSYV